MGRIIKFAPADAAALQCVWTTYKLASRPPHSKWATAARLEESIIDITDPEKESVQIKFDDCPEKHDIGAALLEKLCTGQPELSVYLTARSMRQADIDNGEGVEWWLENDEYEYFKSILPSIIPATLALKHFIRLEAILKDDKDNPLCRLVDLKKMRLAAPITQVDKPVETD